MSRLCLSRTTSIVKENRIAVLYQGKSWYVDQIDTDNSKVCWIVWNYGASHCNSNIMAEIKNLVLDPVYEQLNTISLRSLEKDFPVVYDILKNIDTL